MSFRRRTFPEVLESLLTTITGGVAAESHPFPPPGATLPPFTSDLQQPPASDIVSIWGTLDGQPHLFRKNADYTLSNDGKQLVWPNKGAQYPDPGTLVYVNYRPAGARADVNDVQVGSVLRTLAESTALEIARLYAVLEGVYQSAFVDTATNSALDNVVSLLGIERVRGGRASGEIEFTRAAGESGEITIPAGIRVATADGSVEYETTESVTMRQAQTTLRVVARDLEQNDPLPADALTLLPVPIAGVGRVTNPAPTGIAAQDETDDELRTRAKNVLHGSERATLGAIRQAISGAGITAEIDDTSTPGVIRVTPHVEAMPPDLQQRLVHSLENVRPAGIAVELAAAAAPAKVNLELRLETAQGLLTQDLRAAQRAVRKTISDFFAALELKEAASTNQLVGLVLTVPGVKDVRLVAATLVENGGPPQDVLDVAGGKLALENHVTVLGDLHIADPNLPTLVDVTIGYPDGETPPDMAAVRAALAEAIAALNNANDAAGATSSTTISFAQLLSATPLPGKATPASAVNEALPYALTFALTLETGLTQLLAADKDVYALAPFERLSLSGAEAAVRRPDKAVVPVG
jgi:uncharacterized phage protein gp47/JayE